MIRWKALIPTVLVVAVIGVFFTFFFDDMVECAVEASGTKVNGAKVEIDDLDIAFLKLRVTVDRLQVADENNPMTNSFDVAKLQFDLAGKPLTWKKVIIENAEISGIKTGTARKTSGAVRKKEPPAEPSKDAEAAGPGLAEKAQEAGQAALGNLKEQYDPKKLVRLENLASYKKVQDEQQRLPQVFDALEARVNGLNVEGRADEAKAFVEKVKGLDLSGLEGIKRAKDVLKEGQQVKDNLEAAQKEVSDLKSSVNGEIAAARNGLKEIDRLKQKDIESSMAGLKASFSGEGITRGLVGPVWFGKIETALGWFQKVRKLVPQKKSGEKQAERPARTGRDVHFRFKHNWPAFHLKNASLSGETSGETALTYTGSLRDVTNDPKTLGKPVALELTGQKTGGPQRLTLNATFDYTTDVQRERVKLDYQGIPLAGAKLGNVGGGAVTVKDGMGAVTADLGTEGAALSGRIDFAGPVTLDHQAPGDGNRLNALLHDVLAKVNQLNVGILVSDTIKSPDFKLSTNVDNMFNDAVKQVLAKELEELKAQYRARVNELVDGERQKLAQMVEQRTGVTADKFKNKDQAVAGAREQVNKTLDDLKKKASESLPIPGLPKQEGQSGEQKPALPEIKNPFKKR
jgi:uncharacterized protein (TIGR03545 family)